MNHLINGNGTEPSRARSQAVAVLASIMAASLLVPAPAPANEPHAEVLIPLAGRQLRDPQTLAQVRRQIAGAAQALCASGGPAIYRDGTRRCRQRLIADGERQLQARLLTRTAGREGR